MNQPPPDGSVGPQRWAGSLQFQPGLSLLDVAADVGFSEVVAGGEVVVQAASEREAAFGVGAALGVGLFVV